MNQDIELRLKRIYAAIGETMKADLEEFVPKVEDELGAHRITWSFQGSSSDAQLHNLAYSAIHNVANLKDHLRRYAQRNGKDAELVDQTVRDCLELQVILDLSNGDKHGPLRAGEKGHSGLGPRLVEVRRLLAFEHLKKGETVGGSFRLGRPHVSVDGGARFIITGRIVSFSDTDVGDLHRFLDKAVDAWESLCGSFGLQTS